MVQSAIPSGDCGPGSPSILLLNFERRRNRYCAFISSSTYAIKFFEGYPLSKTKRVYNKFVRILLLMLCIWRMASVRSPMALLNACWEQRGVSVIGSPMPSSDAEIESFVFLSRSIARTRARSSPIAAAFRHHYIKNNTEYINYCFRHTDFIFCIQIYLHLFLILLIYFPAS